MGFDFDAPAALLLLVPALAVTFGLHLASRRRVGIGRRRVALLVRTALLLALVFAIAGFRLVLPVDRLATVYVLDLSDSVGEPGRADAVSWLRDSVKLMPEGDVAGIVGFGRSALVERLPAEVREVDRIATTPVRTATDIGSALRLASALFPDDAQKRIVLLSDGNDTTGSGQTEAALAAARGVQIETRAIGIGAADEVVVNRLTTPSVSKIGEELEAVVEVTSTVAQPATIRLYADGGQIASKAVDLTAGANRVTFLVKPTETGFHTFRAVVEAGRDTFSQNNRADSDTIVNGEPRVLVLAGDAKVAAELVSGLKTEHQQVDTLIPEQLPTGVDGLLAWDSIVLVDVSRLRMTTNQLAAIQQYVRDFGRGLVMIGGPKSYGAGGYTDTPVEETLPVDMGVKDKQKQPDVALVVVIDKSGSMDACHCNSFNNGNPGGGSGIAGVRKVDIGKEAILRAAAAMTARDQLGVVAFDESAHWVVQTQPLGGIGDLRGAIGGIQPLGQTNIFAGLDQAVKSLEGTTATRRHIILLTDGWSTSGQYDAILAQMKAAGITLSTVGAGGGSNPFLEKLAKSGGGRFYPAANPASIPDIFLKETQQVAGQQIVEERFNPILTSQSPILRGIDALPQLLGYNGTTAKSAAQTVLVTPRDDPLLAQWQYGLGRSVAWTSDSTGRWAKAWLGWQGFTKFFSQLVSWTFPGEETGGIEATFVTEGNRTKLRVESVNADGSPRDFYSTAVAMTTPDLTSKAIGLAQIAPGVYEAPIGELDPGAYVIRVSQTRPGSTPLGRTLGLVAPTPAEYRFLGTNEAFLATLRSATDGREIASPDEVWRHDLKTNSSSTDLWPTLLVLALLLWPLDIALRRVSIGRRELGDARRWLSGGWRRSIAPRTVEVGAMMAARDRAAGSSARAALLREPEARPEAPPVAVRSDAASPIAAPEREAALASDRPAAGKLPASPRPPAPTPAAAPAPPRPVDDGDTLSRLRDAKRRARER
ncbi:MAG TPA: VWA domain-containing protein [Candidatus Limnocylindrales bacterium]|nr:VWA domain-containing protein [Candidatus Limnocylindrales bacterium]